MKNSEVLSEETKQKLWATTAMITTVKKNKKHLDYANNQSAQIN